MTEAVEQREARRLALEETHRRHGAAMVEREGWLLPANYGDAAAEYEAVRGSASAGLFDLSARGRVEVSGAEAVQFLNGMITNDVKTLEAGAWMPAAFPNPQGRLVAAARVARTAEGQSFLIDTEPATSAAVFTALERFTLAGDFHVRDLGDETAHLSVQGGGAADIVSRALGEDAARAGRGRAAVVARRDGGSLTVLRATHTGEDGFDVICGAESADEVWEMLVAAGARPAGWDVLEVLRIESGVARYGADADESNVVTEANLDEAVSYTKGCYVGQEIIARIHWRGHVAKKLTGLLLDDEGAAARPGARLKTADGARDAGRITSVAHSPRLGRQVALGYVKYDFLEPGTHLVVAGEGEAAAGRATVAALPLVRGSWHEAAADEETAK
ncbi:MAG TPA: aminomethyltransferase family protein [Pyrinomonadaceae bacterium]|nr:aminomethyltransferase family protein [Pyrinomonadaceae bacterium]